MKRVIPTLLAYILISGVAFAAPSNAQSNNVCPPGYTHSTGINNIDQCVKDGTIRAQYPVTAWRAYYSANPDEVIELSGADLVESIRLGRINSSHIPIYTADRPVTVSVRTPTLEQRRAASCESGSHARGVNGGVFTSEGGSCDNDPSGYASGSTKVYDYVYGPCNGPYTTEVNSNDAEVSRNRIRITNTIPGRASIAYILTGRQRLTHISPYPPHTVTSTTQPCNIIMTRHVAFRSPTKSGVSSSVGRYVEHDSTEPTPRGCVIVVAPQLSGGQYVGHSRTHCMSSADVVAHDVDVRARGRDTTVANLPVCTSDRPTETCKVSN